MQCTLLQLDQIVLWIFIRKKYTSRELFITTIKVILFNRFIYRKNPVRVGDFFFFPGSEMGMGGYFVRDLLQLNIQKNLGSVTRIKYEAVHHT